jgi:hypothetical protein
MLVIVLLFLPDFSTALLVRKIRGDQFDFGFTASPSLSVGGGASTRVSPP